MSDIHSFILSYIDDNPKCIYLEKGHVQQKPRYRARMIFRGEMGILKQICAKYAAPPGESQKNTDSSYLDKRCELGVLRLSDNELYLLLKEYRHLLEENPRIDCAAELLDKKRESYGRGRGNKSKTSEYEIIYQKYIELV